MEDDDEEEEEWDEWEDIEEEEEHERMVAVRVAPLEGSSSLQVKATLADTV